MCTEKTQQKHLIWPSAVEAFGSMCLSSYKAKIRQRSIISLPHMIMSIRLNGNQIECYEKLKINRMIVGAQSYLRLWWRSEWTCRNCISVIPKSFWVRLLQRTAPDCRGFQMKSWKSMEWLLVRCAQLYLRLFLGQTAVPLTCTSLQVAVFIVLGMKNWRLTE